MSYVLADIEALKVLRRALLVFARQQLEASERAEVEIAATIASLERAERRWRGEIQRRRAILAACLAAAAIDPGGGDCSREAYALREAEERLEAVLAWRRRVEQEADVYRGAARRFVGWLEFDLPRATRFLDDRTTALEAYHAARLANVATAVAGLGIVGVVGGVVGAFRRSHGGLNRALGAAGEQLAAQVLSERFGLVEVPFDQPTHGFDRVFHAPGLGLVVMESKVSTGGALRLNPTQAGQQGSPTWIAATVAEMADAESAQWSPANARIAEVIEQLGAANVATVAVVTDPTDGAYTIHVRGEDGSWEVLEED